MFNRLKERLDDLSSPNGDLFELVNRADELFNFIHFLNDLHTRFVITLPEYPKDINEQEAWSDAYYDIEDAQNELIALIANANKAEKYIHICIKEAEYEEQIERTYGSYETQHSGIR